MLRWFWILVRLSWSDGREKLLRQPSSSSRVYINHPLGIPAQEARGDRVVVGFGNEICSMSTNGLSSDHVRMFNPLFPSYASAGCDFLFVPFLFFLSAHSPSCACPTILATIEIKRIDRACTEKETRRTGKTFLTALTYDLFRCEAPTRNIRYF